MVGIDAPLSFTTAPMTKFVPLTSNVVEPSGTILGENHCTCGVATTVAANVVSGMLSARGVNGNTGEQASRKLKTTVTDLLNDLKPILKNSPRINFGGKTESRCENVKTDCTSNNQFYSIFFFG